MMRLIDDPKGQRIALAALEATAAEEREACAKVAEDEIVVAIASTTLHAAKLIAAAIRRRGVK